MSVRYDSVPSDRTTRIDRHAIEAETDVAKLLHWRGELDALVGDVTAQIEAHMAIGAPDKTRLMQCRDALAFARMGRKRVTRRLEALGHVLEWEGRRLEELNKTNRGLQKQVLRGKLDAALAAAARELLADDVFGRLAKRADEILAAEGAAT